MVMFGIQRFPRLPFSGEQHGVYTLPYVHLGLAQQIDQTPSACAFAVFERPGRVMKLHLQVDRHFVIPIAGGRDFHASTIVGDFPQHAIRHVDRFADLFGGSLKLTLGLIEVRELREGVALLQRIAGLTA